MRTTIIICLACYSAALALHAQTNFNIVNHQQNMLPTGGGRSVFELPDGYMMFSHQLLDNEVNSAVHLTKFDLEGNYLFEVPYTGNNQNTTTGWLDPVIADMNGGFTSAVSHFSSSTFDKTFIYRFAEDGDTLWTKLFRMDTLAFGNHGTRQLIQLPDGGYLHCGWCNVPGFGGCITRLDAEGNYLWERIYPNAQYILSMSRTNDGGFILGTLNSNYLDRGTVFKTDELGLLQWQKNFGGHAITDGVGSMQLPDGAYLVPGAWREDAPGSSTDEDQYAALFKYDAGGTFVWRKDHFYGRLAALTAIKASGDGSYWMVGSEHGLPLGKTHVMKIDTEGDTLFAREYYYYSTEGATSMVLGITPTSDGGLVMTGSARQGQADPEPMLESNWLIKLDENGCLVPGCQVVGVREYALDLHQYFSVWPNPTQCNAEINFSFEPPMGHGSHGDLRAVLLDPTGREVITKTYSADGSRFILAPGTLARGVYHLHLADDRSWLAGGKVVVE